MISADYRVFDKGVINHGFILWYQFQLKGETTDTKPYTVCCIQSTSLMQ